jgi:hypothetical protein
LCANAPAAFSFKFPFSLLLPLRPPNFLCSDSLLSSWYAVLLPRLPASARAPRLAPSPLSTPARTADSHPLCTSLSRSRARIRRHMSKRKRSLVTPRARPAPFTRSASSPPSSSVAHLSPVSPSITKFTAATTSARWTLPSCPAPKPKPASKSPRASGHGSGGKRRSPGRGLFTCSVSSPSVARAGAGAGVKPILIPPTPTLSLR